MMCERESQVIAEFRTGALSEALRAHAAECAECGDALMVAGFLSAEIAEEDAGVPAAGLVWFKARLRTQREAVERAEVPLVWGGRIAGGLAAGGIVWALTWARSVSPLLAGVLIASVLILSLTAGGLLLAARGRK